MHQTYWGSLGQPRTFLGFYLRIFNMLCLQNQIYPCCHDLQKDIDSKTHLCDQTRLFPSDLQQALLNYCAFGDSLCIFLLDPATIAKSTCPKAYLKLLSLKGMKDGFKIHCELVFQLGPQLDGSFFDFGAAISALQIIDSEYLNEFYSRTQELAREITIANLPDGNAESLNCHFLSLLHNIGDSTILGITNPYWTYIMTFHRNPSHFTITKLPWELHEVYAELDASNISMLHTPTATNFSNNNSPNNNSNNNKSLLSGSTTNPIKATQHHCRFAL
jgi:hypothetical protein